MEASWFGVVWSQSRLPEVLGAGSMAKVGCEGRELHGLM